MDIRTEQKDKKKPKIPDYVQHIENKKVKLAVHQTRLKMVVKR